MMRFLLPAALAYIAPTLIGWQRRVVGAGTFAILNFLLGWTGLGWIVCMLWAVCARQAGRFTEQQIAEHKEFMRWKAEKLGTPLRSRRPRWPRRDYPTPSGCDQAGHVEPDGIPD